MPSDCIFCKIIKKEIPSQVVYEDKHCLAFLDIRPIHEGHVLVIPKKHTSDIHTADKKTLQHLITATQTVANTVKKTTKADGINIGINNGTAAGQIIFHLHTHIIPRFTDDGLKHWSGKDITTEKLQKIAEQIRKMF